MPGMQVNIHFPECFLQKEKFADRSLNYKNSAFKQNPKGEMFDLD